MAPSASASMGELLLSGWTMLAEGCAQCHVPLMRNPNGLEDFCVGCGRRTSSPGVSTEAAVPQSPEVGDRECIGAVELPEEEHALGSFTRAEPSLGEGGQERPASPASKLADKMLEGWKMLADHCPLCRMPLCESKSGEVRCVGCDLEVRKEASVSVWGTVMDKKYKEEVVKTEAEDKGGENDVGDDAHPGDDLVARRTRVIGRIFQYMDGITGALNEARDSGTSNMQDALLGRLERCADILAKLDGIRLGNSLK